MSSGVFKGNASGTGVVTLETPNTNSDITIALPARAGNLMMDGPAFSAYLATNQTITSNTWTKTQCGTEEFDTNSNYDNVTNYRFTPTVAGYYQINGRISNGPSTNPSGIYVAIYKNGSGFKYGNMQALTSAQYEQGASVSALIYLNGSTDYVELYSYITAATAVVQSGASLCYFQGFLVRGA